MPAWPGSTTSRRARLAPELRGIRGIADRAQHARDVAQHAALAPALLEAARGLALEIDDDEIVLRDEDLAQVQVAVIARLR